MIVEFSVQVTDEHGNPVHGAEVLVHYPWGEGRGVTDVNGKVQFQKRQAFGESALTTIYINGELQADSVWIEDGSVLAFQTGTASGETENETGLRNQ